MQVWTSELTLIVSFQTKNLLDCCTKLEVAEEMIGSAHAQALITLLSDAEAADTAAELIELYRPNVAADGDQFSLLVGTRCRLSFVAIGHALDRDRDGALDWSKVRRLKIMELAQC